MRLRLACEVMARKRWVRSNRWAIISGVWPAVTFTRASGARV